MSKPITVGVTGGIGAGKTLVTKLFKLLKIPTYYADDRAKELMNNELVESISNAFGTESYTNGKLNRAYLASMVFSNPTELQKLNAIVHPAVAKDFELWKKAYAQAPYVVKEAALLIEAGSYKQLDLLLVVTAPVPLRKNRIKRRDPFRSEKEIADIIANQMLEEEKVRLADFVIANDEQRLLIPQVIEIDKKIRQR